MTKSFLIIVLIICLISSIQSKVQLKTGKLSIRPITPQQPQIIHSIDVFSQLKSQIILTQSSKVKIQGKLTFTSQQFAPEFIAFRLVNKKYNNLTEPVLAQFDSKQGILTAQLDIGNPLVIQPYSDVYSLEILIGDDNLEKNLRNTIAKFTIKFRKSLSGPVPSDFHYQPKNQIIFNLPPERIDPPKIYTLFVTGLIITSFLFFLYGLNFIKVNLNLFPSNGSGALLNLIFIGCILAILGILVKFWVNWTFLQTLKYLLMAVIPTVLFGNYAILNIKK